MKQNRVSIALAIVSIAAPAWSALAQPGQGLHAGRLTLHPFADVSATYDSNIAQAENHTDSDEFLESSLGVKGDYSLSTLSVKGVGFFSDRRYWDATDMGFQSGGELLGLSAGTRDTLQFRADQSFRRVEDTDRYGSEFAIGSMSPNSGLDTSTRSRRDVFQNGIFLGRDFHEQVGIDAGYRFDSVSYDHSQLVDLREHAGQAEMSYTLSERTAALLSLETGFQDSPNTSVSADRYAARVGLKTHGTDKIDIKAGAGVQQYNGPGSDDTLFNFDVSAAWNATEKVLVQAGGRNGSSLSPLYTDAGTDFFSFWLGARYRLTPAWRLTGTGLYRVDDYRTPIQTADGMIDRTDRGGALRARADYTSPNGFLGLYGEASHERVDSNVSDSDETRVVAGVTLTY